MNDDKPQLRESVLVCKPIELKLGAIKGTGIQHVGKHFDIVLAVDMHWTMVGFTPPIPLPMPHPFVGMVFDVMDYIVFDIPVPSSLQGLVGAASIPMGGRVKVHGRHKATTTTSVMGLLLPSKHLTSLPGYAIPNIPGSPDDGEVYYGSSSVFAQTAELGGDQPQHVLTCWCPPMGVQVLPTAPSKLSKNPLRYLALYNHMLSNYVPLNFGNPVIVGGTFQPHTYSIGEMAMRLGGIGLVKGLGKGAGKIGKSLGRKSLIGINRGLRKLIGNNPLSRRLCDAGFEPVNFVTGAMFFEWDDFKIHGNTPIKWSNTYHSDLDVVGALGNGVINNWDLSIHPDFESGIAAWMHPDENKYMPIPIVAVGEESEYYRTHKIWMQRPNANTWIIRKGLDEYHYQSSFDSDFGEIYKCKKIYYNDGTIITLSHQGPYGLLHKLQSSDGREIHCVADRNQKQLKEVYYQYGKFRELQVRYDYDDNGNLTHVWDGKNQAILFKYNSDNLLIHRTNRNGMQYRWEYDSQKRVIYTTGLDNFQEGRLNYYPDKGYNEVIYPGKQGKTEQYHYDKNDLVYLHIDGEGGERWYEYTSHYELKMSSTPEGKVEGFAYDVLGNIKKYHSIDGQEYQYTYNKQGQLTHRRDPLGNSEIWSYDELHRLKKYTNALGKEVDYQYEASNRLPMAIYEGERLGAHFQYGDFQLLRALTNDEGLVQQWRYDRYGRLLLYSPRERVTTYLERDTSGRVIRLSGTDQQAVDVTYDAYDLPIHLKTHQLEVFLEYTPMGSVKKQRSRELSGKQSSREQCYQYDAYENLLSITNEKQEQYHFTRNHRDEVIEEVEFDQSSKKYYRNKDGQVLREQDHHNRETYYQYDQGGRLAHIRYEDGSYQAYYYNKNGLLIRAENQHTTIGYQRNAMGMIAQETQNGHAVNYTYNDKGQLVAVESSLGATVNYDYNPLGELSQVGAFNPQQGIEKDSAWKAVMQYTQNGQLQSRELDGGVRSEFKYDHLGMPISQKISVRTKTHLDQSQHWNSASQLVAVVNELIGRQTRYQYDAFGGLSAAFYDSGKVQYKSPDEVGNLYETADRKDRIYDKGGKLLRDRNWYYDYDTYGNLRLKSKRKLSDSNIPKEPIKDDKYLYETRLKTRSWIIEEKWEGPDYGLKGDDQKVCTHKTWNRGDWLYEWSPDGMLQYIRNPDGETIVFEYDALGRRTAKIAGNTIYRYIWDANVLLHQWSYDLVDRPKLQINDQGALEYDRPEPLTNLVTWVYELNSFVPCAKLVGGKKYSIVADYIGRPIQAFDQTGTRVWSADYDIYGDLRRLEGDRDFIPFRQLGQYEDSETGLYYNRFRYYSPETGLYLSKDPIGLAGNNPNLYAYTRDSNTQVDVLGLMSQPKGTPYKLDANGRWHDSNGKFTSFSWPPDDGFLGARKTIVLPKDMLIDRYGGWYDSGGEFNDRGRFLAESGVPFTDRAMPPVKDGTILTTYKVKNSFEVDSGQIAPWFGEKGGALQFFSKNSTVGDLINSGHIEVVTRKTSYR